MWIPRAYLNEEREDLLKLIEGYPFGLIISQGEGGEPFGTHLPFMVEPRASSDAVLLGHMARANPHWRSWNADSRVLVVFQGPHAYVSPSWYAQQTTVPTWNYAVVHAYGTPRLIHDPERLRPIVERLTKVFEEGTPGAWTIERAAPILDAELKGIVGFEIPIDRLEGKFKLNQNRSREDQLGVVQALEATADPLKVEVARMMRRNLEGGSP